MSASTNPPGLPSRRSGAGRPSRARPRPDGCPSCGARMRPDQQWCTLCHTAVSGPPAAQVEPTAPVERAAVQPDDERIRAAEALLAELAVAERRSGVPPALVGRVPEGPVGKTVLALGTGVLLLTVLLGGLGMLGLLL